MSSRSDGPADLRTASVIRWLALFGLFNALPEMALSLPRPIGFQGSAIAMLGAAVRTVFLGDQPLRKKGVA